MTKRQRRTATVAALLMTGAIVLQVGPACAMLGNLGLASFDFSTVLDENEQFLGLFSPCGRPDVLYVDEDGTPLSDVYYSDDNMIFDCPVTNIVGTPPSVGGGGGGGGGGGDGGDGGN